MRSLTENLEKMYYPKTALVFYETEGYAPDCYVECLDMDRNGKPANARPLSVQEAQKLSKSLDTRQEKSRSFLHPQGILPASVLHYNLGGNGSVLWFTPAGERKLFFSKNLEIQGDKAHIPPLLWKADKNSLRIFALFTHRKPAENTPLYHAPFFNIYRDGRVCMGTVNVEIKNSASLENFMALWEKYFFNSYFSHLMGGHEPTKTNCFLLWKKLVETQEIFPKKVLIKTSLTVKDLL